MKKNIIKKLPQNAKSIKVIGQGCLDDCSQSEKISGTTRLWSHFACYLEICEYRHWKDAQWTTDF